MGQGLHGSATTTHAIRAAIQRSKASLQALARATASTEDGRQWRRRTSLGLPTDGTNGSAVKVL